MVPESSLGRAVTFRVGGLSFAISCENCALFAPHSPEYRPFLSPGPIPGDETVRVELRVGEFSAPAGEKPLLVAGDSWTLSERQGKLVMTPRAAGEGDAPPWQAEIDPVNRVVRVTCSGVGLERRGDLPRVMSPFHYPLDQVVVMVMLAGEGAILHAAGIDLNGRGVILAGPSRAGKTTLSRLCAEAGVTVFSDDRIIVRRIGEEYRMFGTPWPGEGGYAVNRSVPLSALVFLTKGEESILEFAAPAAAVRRLLPVLSLPRFDPVLAGSALDVCRDMVTRCSAHELVFRPDPSAVSALEAAFP